MKMLFNVTEHILVKTIVEINYAGYNMVSYLTYSRTRTEKHYKLEFQRIIGDHFLK